MGYSMDSLEDGCYEGTTVLVNKFDIREGKKLDIVEQGITSALITKAMLVENYAKKIDFSKMDKDLFMIATIKSVSGDVFLLKDIFRGIIV